MQEYKWYLMHHIHHTGEQQAKNWFISMGRNEKEPDEYRESLMPPAHTTP